MLAESMVDVSKGNPVRWADENAHLAKAEEIQQQWPQWLVWWGVCSRLYWAIPNFDMSTRIYPYSEDPDALVAQMDQAEQKYRVRRAARR